MTLCGLKQLILSKAWATSRHLRGISSDCMTQSYFSKSSSYYVPLMTAVMFSLLFTLSPLIIHFVLILLTIHSIIFSSAVTSRYWYSQQEVKAQKFHKHISFETNFLSLQQEVSFCLVISKEKLFRLHVNVVLRHIPLVKWPNVVSQRKKYRPWVTHERIQK